MLAKRGKSSSGASSTTANALATTGAPVNVSNAAPPVAGQVQVATSPTQIDWRFGMPEGWVSVADYKAVGNGTTVDDTAFQNAIASGAKVVFMPPGTYSSPKRYLLSQTLNIQKGQTLLQPCHDLPLITDFYQDGSGHWNVDLADLSTCILFAGTTNYCVDQQYESLVDGVFVMQHNDYIPTAGGAFHQGHASILTWTPRLHNCLAELTYNGVSVSGHQTGSEVINCVMSDPVNACYHVDLGQPYGALRWRNLHSQGGYYGMHVRGCDTSSIVGMKINGANIPLYLAGDHAAVVQMNFSNLIIEDVLNSGDVIVFGGSTYAVESNTIDLLHFYTGTANVNLKHNSNSALNTITNIHARQLKYIDAGDSNELLGGRFRAFGTVLAGTAITLNGTNAILSGLRVRDYTNGLSFGAGANYATLGQINLSNNTNALAAASDAAAKATGKGRGIIGLADWG